MTRTCALIPVKAPERSKSRLAPVLEQSECADLSIAMLNDVLAALTAAQCIDAIAVLTADARVADLVAAAGHQVLPDFSADLCSSLDSAARQISAAGFATLLVIPADMPTVGPADIDALIARHQGGLSISPAIRDGGTNALVCSPPDAVTFCFGNDSARRHLQSAARAGIDALRVPVPAFFRDVDLPDDLLWLSNELSTRKCGRHTQEFLRDSGITARLRPGATGTTG